MLATINSKTSKKPKLKEKSRDCLIQKSLGLQKKTMKNLPIKPSSIGWRNKKRKRKTYWMKRKKKRFNLKKKGQCISAT